MKNTDLINGFVYIWFDSLRKMFYIGSHSGHVHDGYNMASSVRLQRAVKKRPQTFKRRILAHINGQRRDLLAEETRWLQMIRVDELGTKYYNLKRLATGGNLMEGRTFEEIQKWRQRVSDGGRRSWSAAKPERREKARINAPGGQNFNREFMKAKEYTTNMREACMGEKNGFFGKTHLAESKLKMSVTRKQIPPNRTRDFIFTSPQGQIVFVTNLSKFMAQHGNAKLTRFLKTGCPVQLRNNQQHPLTGWTVKYA